jgi:inosine-uridine nucleoside N-ribohydrolase
MEWEETTMTNEQYLKNLEVPSGEVDVVLDTDAFNEIDDQFAIAYLLANTDKLKLKAIYAAPFLNKLVETAKEGMEKSYDEILRLLTLLEKQEYQQCTYKGSDMFLADESTPVQSQAAVELVKLAKQYSPKKPLYVITIGAITNIASALLFDPTIAGNIVVVWLGGQSREYHDTKEFNLYQDIAAARVVFQSGVPIVQLPCKGVVSGFAVSYAELEYYLKGANQLCDFLVGRVKEALDRYAKGTVPSRVLWDVVAVAWLINEDDRFMLSRIDSLAIPEYNHQYSYDTSKQMRYIYYVKRDALVTDLFKKLSNGACENKLWKKED